MRDDDRLPFVQRGHERVQRRVAEVEAPAVGGDLHAIRVKMVQGKCRLLDGPFHIRQGQCGAIQEAPRVLALYGRAAGVELPRGPARLFPVIKIGVRRRHGKQACPDGRLVHEGQMPLHLIGGQRKGFRKGSAVLFKPLHLVRKNRMRMDVNNAPGGHRRA